jgi:uncharacterized protein YqjF (DUF2071 family)
MVSPLWILQQRWEHLLFVHWPVALETVRRLVPAVMEIDRFEGQAWLTMVPFRVANLRLSGLPPLPGLSAFPQINLRTYVRVNREPGVYFFSLDAGSAPAVLAAGQFFYVPYYFAEMVFWQDGHSFSIQSTRTGPRNGAPAEFVARYAPIGSPYRPAPGALDYFLVERTVLFTTSPDGALQRGEVKRWPWQLQAAEAAIERNTIPRAAGFELPACDPVCHYAAFAEGAISRVLPLAAWR